MNKYIILFSVILIFLFTATAPVQAACPTAITTDNIVITSSDICIIPAGSTFIMDKATSEESTTNTAQLSLTGGSLTIANTSKLIAGSIVPTGGSIIIQTGGSVVIGGSSSVAYVTDADADGFTPSLSAIYFSSGAGRRRLALMSSTTQIDCYDNNANARPGSTYCGSSHRGDGSYDYNCSSTSTKCGTTYYGLISVGARGKCCGDDGTSCCGACGSCTGVDSSAPVACGANGSIPGGAGYCQASGGCGYTLYTLSAGSGKQACQ